MNASSPEASGEELSLVVLGLSQVIAARISDVLREQPEMALSLPQFRALDLVSQQPGLSLTEFAAALGVRKPTASVMAARLESLKLLTRTQQPGRRISLHVTSQGAVAIQTMSTRFMTRVGPRLDALTPTERADVRAALVVLYSALTAP
jgi:DNA-binding MarR family transcriptional regulator